MTKQKINWQKVYRGMTISKWVFWGLILVFVLAGIMQLVLAANGGPGQPATLETLVSSQLLGTLVGIIAVVMVIIAGIVYAFDLGGGKQIGVAKEMLTAAIGGVLLFMFASWLLLNIGKLFPKTPTPQTMHDVWETHNRFS